MQLVPKPGQCSPRSAGGYLGARFVKRIFDIDQCRRFGRGVGFCGVMFEFQHVGKTVLSIPKNADPIGTLGFGVRGWGDSDLEN